MKAHLLPFRLFAGTALVLLLAAVALGVLSAWTYIDPEFLRGHGGLTRLRPMHTSAALFWIIIGANAILYGAIAELAPQAVRPAFVRVHWIAWLVALAGIFTSYAFGRFGGREYWEFPPVWALPIATAWLCFLPSFLPAIRSIRKWPVYVWMWMTGVVFFLFTFSENYLWTLPWFRDTLITDMTIQWKVNGSLVGSWNQILYGTALFLMARVSGDHAAARSKMAFAMYFLGLFNLMFNWGHHIYTLPTAPYVRYVAYAVSMTEWVIFIRVLWNWRHSLTAAQRHAHALTARFLFAAEAWAFFHLGQALLMSIPALNLYTHGTHVTVAHAMGTTIGINSMILLGALFYFTRSQGEYSSPFLKYSFWTFHYALLCMIICLDIAGIMKGWWQMQAERSDHGSMMLSLRPWFMGFVCAGVVVLAGLALFAAELLRRVTVQKKML